MKHVILMVAFLGLSLWAEDAESVYAQGLAKLRESETNHAALVPATKLLAKAAALFADSNQDKASEVAACLYWAKKKMTLADTNDIKYDTATYRQVEKATAPSIALDPENEARKLLSTADTYAKSNKDPLLIAVRYFEIGDRFPSTASGRIAIQSCLKFISQASSKSTERAQPLGQRNTPFGITILAADCKSCSKNLIRQNQGYTNLTMCYGSDGFGEWEVFLPTAGQFFILISYATAESRPCRFLINGQAHGEVLQEKTGGYKSPSLKWKSYGPYSFEMGKNAFRLEAVNSFPHIKGFVISTSGKVPDIDPFDR